MNSLFGKIGIREDSLQWLQGSAVVYLSESDSFLPSNSANMTIDYSRFSFRLLLGILE